ncbi:hypothetical protein PYW07_013354 [Mythimna separata]|uniref:Cell cycle control protein 50A n=1 Tax=Mythimna separata TaxID=271217 RepID=A0AAD7Y6L7_MYTSE|nr:hypothetical protein PYW07_013354 [Mythimna separata]
MADHENDAELCSIKNESADHKEVTNVSDSQRDKVEEYKEKPVRKESTTNTVQNEESQNMPNKKIKDHLNYILLGIAIFGLILSIVGLVLPKENVIKFEDYEIVKDYTDCTKHVPGAIEPRANQTKCKDSLNATVKECICSIQLEIKKDMLAPVTAFYELDPYDQIEKNYSQSRDDDQLAGHLSSEPSESCGSYTYACGNETSRRKPIAPCGRLADAMFNDSFSLQRNNVYLTYFRYGLISEDEKKQYQNPEPASNLSLAFRNFSKPMNWRMNVWELDIGNPDNNGFRNEPFIIWMKTDLKRKPAWRVNHTGEYEKGLPASNYSLRVTYAYPTQFGGRRKFILSSPDGNEVVQDYTDCVKYGTEIQCKDYINDSGQDCKCFILIEVKKPLTAPVTAFYELEAYDQISRLYSKSRDDDQLAGHLSLEPSESCGSYTYACENATARRKPIAPCGRLADAMFTDTFKLETNNESLTYIRYGLIAEDDKEHFHNPVTVGNLSNAFINFSKPMSWRKNVWELDIGHPDNNGFRNEQFIIWMKTDLKRKPVWRVNHTGVYEKALPAANYTLKVTYDYPTSRFSGRRKFIMSAKQKNVILAANAGGVTLLVIGLLCFITATCVLLYRCRRHIIRWIHT